MCLCFYHEVYALACAIVVVCAACGSNNAFKCSFKIAIIVAALGGRPHTHPPMSTGNVFNTKDALINNPIDESACICFTGSYRTGLVVIFMFCLEGRATPVMPQPMHMWMWRLTFLINTLIKLY